MNKKQIISDNFKVPKFHCSVADCKRGFAGMPESYSNNREGPISIPDTQHYQQWACLKILILLQRVNDFNAVPHCSHDPHLEEKSCIYISYCL